MAKYDYVEVSGGGTKSSIRYEVHVRALYEENDDVEAVNTSVALQVKNLIEDLKSGSIGSNSNDDDDDD